MAHRRVRVLALAILFSGYALAAETPVFPCGEAILIELSVEPSAVKTETVHGQVFWIAPARVEQDLRRVRILLDGANRRLEEEELPSVQPHENKALSELASIAVQLGLCRRYQAAETDAAREALVVEMMQVFHAERELVVREMGNLGVLIPQLAREEGLSRFVVLSSLPPRAGATRDTPTDELIATVREWATKSDQLRESRVRFFLVLAGELLLGDGRWAQAVRDALVATAPEFTKMELQRDIRGLEARVEALEAELKPARELNARLKRQGVEGWMAVTATETPDYLQGVEPSVRDLMILARAVDASNSNAESSRLETRIAPREEEQKLLRASIAKRRALLALFDSPKP